MNIFDDDFDKKLNKVEKTVKKGKFSKPLKDKEWHRQTWIETVCEPYYRENKGKIVEPFDGDHAARHWWFAVTTGTVPYESARKTIKDISAGKVVLPVIDDNFDPKMLDENEFACDTLRLGEIRAGHVVGDSRNVFAFLQIAIAPELVSAFESDPNFFTVPIDWKPKAKMN